MVFLIFVIAVTLTLILLFFRDLRTTARIKRIDKTLKTYLQNEQEKSKEGKKAGS
jgi:uncharacterized membrane protein